MWKKVSAALLLSVTLMFGGIFSVSADASVTNEEKPVQVYSNIYWSMNNGFKNLSCDHLNDYFDKIFNQEKAQEENDDASQEAPQEPESEQPEEGQTDVEQPETEQPEAEQPVEQPTEQPQQSDQTDGQVEQLSQFEQEVVELTNVEREKNGLEPLKADKELSRVAREKSNNMAEVGYFDHNSPTYGSPFDMMQSYGIDYRTAGENIAKGQQTPEEVVNAWMNSSGHRANILNGDFTHIGVGYVEQGNHWTQMFTGN